MARPGAIRRAMGRLRFAFERLMTRGLRYRLLLAAVIVGVVALVGGLVGIALGAGFSDPGEAIWWAFLRLTDPGYLGDDEGFARRSLSTVVTVAGYVLFLGLLIAILTQWMNELITKFESGVTPVELSDHIVVLGWSHRTPAIVRDLLLARERAARFLANRTASELVVVVLAPQVDAALVQELRDRLGDRWDDRRVIVRAGTALRLEHLERVAFRDAAVLMLPGPGFGESDPAAFDSQTIKTLMSISQHVGEADPPLAVVELGDERRASLAERAYSGAIRVSVPDAIVTKLMVSSLRKPGICDVFVELLTVGMGAGLYLRSLSDAGPLEFGELQDRCVQATPIGVLDADGQPRLSPAPSMRVDAQTPVVYVAHRFEDCKPGPARTEIPTTERSPIPVAPAPPTAGRRLLILGWSRKVPLLLRALESDGDFWTEIDVASGVPIRDREEDLVRIGVEPSQVRARQLELDLEVPEVLENLVTGGYDNILRVASERMSHEEEADATSASIYLALQHALPDGPERPALLFELLDEENAFLFDVHRDDVIVSSLAASYLISQIALRHELAPVFERMGERHGARIRLRPLQDYGLPAKGFGFEAFQREASRRGQIALGIRKDAGDRAGVWLNPPHDAEWTIEPRDTAIVLEEPPSS